MKKKLKKNKPIKYDAGVWVVFWIVMGLAFLLAPFLGVLHLGIFFLLKTNFEQWTRELNTNPNHPFLLVLFFGLLGHIAYYIYCKSI